MRPISNTRPTIKGSTTLRIIPSAAVLLLCLGSVETVKAMPNFSRREGIECAACHRGIPRLNELGYLYRAAGFRNPDQIGKQETTKNLAMYFAARSQNQAGFTHTELANGNTHNSGQLLHTEMTLYPITGAFDKNWSSLTELSVSPEDFFEIENAYVRYDRGGEGSFFSARAGIFHPFEGYGATDRPLALTRPLFQTTAAANSLFKPWGFDEVGIEAGYDIGNTSIRGTVFNGLFYNPEEKQAFPAQGGQLNKTYGQPSYNNKDFQVLATQRLSDEGGGISGYFYTGWMDKSDTLQNTFQRYALYASYPIKMFNVLGGFQMGQDQFDATGSAASPKDVNSNGAFGEIDYGLKDLVWVGARYDWFDPSTDIDNNEIQAGTAFLNWGVGDGVQFITEYKFKDAKKSATTDQYDQSVQLRMIFIY